MGSNPIGAWYLVLPFSLCRFGGKFKNVLIFFFFFEFLMQHFTIYELNNFVLVFYMERWRCKIVFWSQWNSLSVSRTWDYLLLQQLLSHTTGDSNFLKVCFLLCMYVLFIMISESFQVRYSPHQTPLVKPYFSGNVFPRGNLRVQLNISAQRHRPGCNFIFVCNT